MVKRSVRSQILGLISWFVVCFVAAGAGAVASIEAKSFYGQLVQPVWAPPASVFGPVWTILYALMAVSVWLVWRSGSFRTNRIPLALFLCQLGLNALWSWLFFAWHLGAMGLMDIGVLWFFIVATLGTFWRIHRVAGALFIPYLLWVSFAAALNYSVWQLNSQMLG